MKNIHVIPTDKPSRLHYSKVKTENEIAYKLILKSELSKCNDGLLSSQRNIYITSDEEIKGYGEVVFDIKNNKVVKWEHPIATTTPYFKKIILSTDQDLIKDGVQAIDDDFLEWFVKNPSCEEVEVKDVFKSSPIGFGNAFDYYKIIIPKEEPKQIKSFEDVLDESLSKGKIILEELKAINAKQETPESIIQDIATHLSKTVPETLQHIEEFSKELDKLKSKQETLEEAAEKWCEKNNCGYGGLISDSFENGAKWQQQNSYSEEDLREAFKQGQDNMDYSNMYGWDTKLTEQEWFEQFKKK